MKTVALRQSAFADGSGKEIAMDQFIQLSAMIAVLWIVLTAIVLMVSRRHALAMNRWAGRVAVRAIRATVGGIFIGLGRLFVGLGNWIRH